MFYRYVILENISYKLLNYNHELRQFPSGCPERLRDLRLGLRMIWPAKGDRNLISFDKQCAVLTGIHTQARVDVTCEGDATGRYLVIQIEGIHSVLTMCEVEVFENVSGK